MRAIATSQAPCGYCRQFLYEFDKGAEMMVISPDKENSGYLRTTLANLLPRAFGPSDLANPTGLMAPATALAAAEKSYAPYTRNFAGCGLQISGGEIFKGRCAESAAFNPSLTALHCAILSLNMATFDARRSVQRAVLVEKPASVSQPAPGSRTAAGIMGT